MNIYRYMAAALLVFGAGAPAAQACAWYPPVDLTHAYMTDLIIEGRVADFTVSDFHRAVLRLDNVKAIKGDVSDTVEIAILADGPVDHFRREAGTEVIVGAARASRLPADLAERAEGLPLIHVPICTNPFIVPANSKNRGEIETSVRSHEVLMHPIP